VTEAEAHPARASRAAAAMMGRMVRMPLC
jgi:hypothetical protein